MRDGTTGIGSSSSSRHGNVGQAAGQRQRRFSRKTRTFDCAALHVLQRCSKFLRGPHVVEAYEVRAGAEKDNHSLSGEGGRQNLACWEFGMLGERERGRCGADGVVGHVAAGSPFVGDLPV